MIAGVRLGLVGYRKRLEEVVLGDAYVRGREVVLQRRKFLVCWARQLPRSSAAATFGRIRPGSMRVIEKKVCRADLTGLTGPRFLERFMATRLGSTTHISVLDGDGWACEPRPRRH